MILGQNRKIFSSSSLTFGNGCNTGLFFSIDPFPVVIWEPPAPESRCRLVFPLMLLNGDQRSRVQVLSRYRDVEKGDPTSLTRRVRIRFESQEGSYRGEEQVRVSKRYNLLEYTSITPQLPRPQDSNRERSQHQLDKQTQRASRQRTHLFIFFPSEDASSGLRRTVPCYLAPQLPPC